MKALICLGLLSFVFSLPLRAQDNDREVKKGTVLNYSVKEGTVSYKLKVSVMEWTPEGAIKIQWQTTGGKISKGSCTMDYAALQDAATIKMKLKPGAETLSMEESRWFVGFETFDYMHNMGIESNLDIDGQKITFLPDESITEKAVVYNNEKTTMDYVEGTQIFADEKRGTIVIGFIAYTDDIILMNKYKNGNFSMDLVSIQSPLSQMAIIKKEADKSAAEIMKALAPKGPVKLTKMKAAKFAVVKPKYPVLATIENYDPTNAGTVIKPTTETYEYRINTNSKNPPSLIDCLTADIKIIYEQRNSFGIGDMAEVITDKSLPADAAKKILSVYMSHDYGSLPGFRPWSNWRFINSLSDNQRNQLANELEGYVSEYGFISE